MKRRNIIILSIVAVVVVMVGVAVWNMKASSTRIAFVNYQAINLGQIAKANDNSFIKITDLAVDDVAKAGNYDMVFVNGMGLRITEEQREALQKAAEGGTPVLTTAATNPQNLIVSVDSVDSEFLKQYLNGGGRGNYRNMLNYVRKYIDGKTLFVHLPGDPVAAATGLLYHPDVETRDGEEVYFDSVEEYNAYLQKHNLYRATSPAIILTGQMGVPDSLISALERSGNVVYAMRSLQSFIQGGHADSVRVSAVINMAHGRMGDAVVEYLKGVNAPLFAPLNVNCDYNEWLADNMGMSGGFLSQSVVTPEIDGAVRPYALFAQYEGRDGLPYVAAIPDRLDDFVATVNNYVSLRSKANKDKRVAIFYFKGPGQNALVAEGMEVVPSLYNMLKRLKSEGYTVTGLPATVEEFASLLNERGRVFGTYAVGEQQDFVKHCSPEVITRKSYDQWCSQALSSKMRADIDAVDGEFPGHGMRTESGDMAIARIELGNITLLPQPAAGTGDDEFKMVHGTDMAPTHNYVAAYLWARYGMEADALMHFGTHGSLEFTPRKQVALSSNDWPDRLVGILPHFYIYTISNVGEAMMAKRRSYATIIDYLTPPFMESNVRGIYKNLSDAIAAYNKAAEADNRNESAVANAASQVKHYTVALGIHRELRLDSVMSKPYSADEIERIESFAEELANQKITGAHYVMGEAYGEQYLVSTTYAMTVDPIAYSLYALDKQRGRVSGAYNSKSARFTHSYLEPARALVNKLLSAGREATDEEICRIAGVTAEEYTKAREIESSVNDSKDMLSRMMVMGSTMRVAAPTAKLAERPDRPKHRGMMRGAGMSPEKALAMAKMMGADSVALKKMEAAMKAKSSSKAAAAGGAQHSAMMSDPEYSVAEIEKATAIMEISRAVGNVTKYYNALKSAPQSELSSIINALSGGYVAPSSGGDPVLNPQVLPTGRNLFAINAEETPSAAAWEKGKSLADNTLKLYRQAHNDSLPRKVSYTLWSSEFIETEGATIAQVMYMLGVEPVRDPFGRVTDLRLIPSEELGRSRIDVVVQTSGQLRDLAASRLFLISKAVNMAAESTGDKYPNFVAEGVVESERHLVDKGISPKEARELSTARVFGGVNGNYGSGIQEMVEAGDRWDDESEIAETYINNMGAMYGSEADWEKMREYAFEAALTRTDAVVQPRQSNTWGALSLDHVYEFMGGMNLAVRNVTGKDPEAYLSDYRNRNNAKMQEVKEAIGVESRTTILNPNYIKEKMKGGAGDASELADVVRNTYGWNVMKPKAIDNELWDDIYSTYVEDKNNLGTKEYFKEKNPAAIEEITAVMLETVRKGMWNATPEQVAAIAELHTEVVNEYRPSCSGFVCNNAKLRDFIASKVPEQAAADYRKSISQIRDEQVAGDGTVMKKEELNQYEMQHTAINGLLIAVGVIVALVGFFVVVRRRRKKADME